MSLLQAVLLYIYIYRLRVKVFLVPIYDCNVQQQSVVGSLKTFKDKRINYLYKRIL